MKCIKPFISRGGAFGCGQCLPCRVSRRRMWTHRLMLEGLDHADKCFITLTYEKDRRDLSPLDLQLWLKRMRKRANAFPGANGEGRKLRHYSVGEYGSRTLRPHYHVALFGWPPCSGPRKQASGVCECLSCSVVRQTWDFGFVLVGRLEMKSAQYIAGYVLKKMTHRSDPRLRGREPEFARMSLRPGIGANAMWNVASEILRYGLEDRQDVPLTLAWAKKELPLGRYLRSKLREMVDADPKFKEAYLQKAANQMQIVRAFAWNNSRSVASVFEELNGVYAARIEARERLNTELKHEAI